MFFSIFRYAHTLKYLKPIQIYGRIWHRVRRPLIKPFNTPPATAMIGPWVDPIPKNTSMLAQNRFRFLQLENEIEGAKAWNHPEWPRLWLYNLHYFDDLNALDSDERTEWHGLWLSRWIRENPPGTGCGWEPYPTSLRMVNWIKWSLAGHRLDEKVLANLATQARWLNKNIEYYLQGNHLIANAKALLFAGLFFQGREASVWRDRGFALLKQEVREQILDDGGHYERSPMYHSLVYEDLLDLINLFRGSHFHLPLALNEELAILKLTAQKMGRWLANMSHPDREIALFNDSAHGVAARPSELEAYSVRLGLGGNRPAPESVVHLEASGFVTIKKGGVAAFLEVGGIGPSYLPGHAHAGTLGFELSFKNHRILVDTGVSSYDPGPKREKQRSTASHNTVTVDQADSSEVWASHRVARRAAARATEIVRRTDRCRVSAVHDGFTRLRGVGKHKRIWTLTDGTLTVTDEVEGKGQHRIHVYWHFHPEIQFLKEEGFLYRLGKNKVQLEFVFDSKTRIQSQSFDYHPNFGVDAPSTVIVNVVETTLPAQIQTLIRWDPV